MQSKVNKLIDYFAIIGLEDKLIPMDLENASNLSLRLPISKVHSLKKPSSRVLS